MRLLCAAVAVWILALAGAMAQPRSLFPGTIDQHPAIDYRGSALNDAVTVLFGDRDRDTLEILDETKKGWR